MTYASIDVGFVASTVNDCRVFFGNAYLTSGTELFDRGRFQIQTELLSDDLSACQSCDILQHRFATVAETRSFYSNSVERTAQFVDNQHSQRFAFDVFSNDNESFTLLNNFLKQRQNVLSAADFLVSDQDVWVLQNRFHLVRVRNHVRGDVAAIELHAFYNFHFCCESAGFFNGNYAVFTHFFHSFSDQFANFFVSCGDCCNLSDRLFVFDWLRDFLQFENRSFYRFVDSFANNHWVRASCYVFQTFTNHRLSQNSSSCRTVAGYVVCFCCNFFNELGAHVFKSVFQFDFFCDCYAVVRNQWAAEFLLQYHVSSFRSECYFYRVCQCINAAKHRTASFFAEQNLFSHYRITSLEYKLLCYRSKTVMCKDDN